jgi:hypothetical protein
MRRDVNVYPYDVMPMLLSAKGEFWLVLSDDDWLEPTFMEKALELWFRELDLVFVHSRCQVHQGDLVTLTPIFPEVQEGHDLVRDFFHKGRGPAMCATLLHTADVIRIGGYPPDFVMGDAPVWTTLAFGGRVGFVSEPLAHYSVHSSNATITTPIDLFMRDGHRLTEVCVENARQKGLGADYIEEIRRNGRRRVARVLAGHIAWRAGAGASKADLLWIIGSTYKNLGGDPAYALPVVVAALTLPRWMLPRIHASLSKLKAQRNAFWHRAGHQ